MRIASISLVKNEADIIECFVRHNMVFVDKMYIIDDRSTDTTPEILRRLAEEFPNLSLVPDDWRGGFFQGPRTTKLMDHALTEEEWDIVAALDADEFIAAPSRQVLEEDLAAIPTGMAGAFGEICYIPSPQDDPAIVDPRHRILTSINRNGPDGFKAIVPRSLRRHGHVAYDNGNHRVTFEGVTMPNWRLPRVMLAHYPVRSIDQAILKALMHYVAWTSCHSYSPAIATHVTDAADILRAEPSLAAARGLDIVAQFMPDTRVAPHLHTPLAYTPGTIQWPELAIRRPYGQLITLLDELVARAAEGDRLIASAEAAGMGTDAVQALVDERDALRKELKALRGSGSQLTSAYVALLRAKLARSMRKRRLKFRALLSRFRAARG